jgi:preprotein translocase subunit YajC
MIQNFLISDSFAQTTETATNAGAQDFSFTSLVPLILIFAVFYFLIVRPQSKKMKDLQEMVNSLKIGNKVITNGGIVGVVKEVHAKENQVEIEIASGVNVRILKNYISDVIKDEKEVNNKAKNKPNAKK